MLQLGIKQALKQKQLKPKHPNGPSVDICREAQYPTVQNDVQKEAVWSYCPRLTATPCQNLCMDRNPSIIGGWTLVRITYSHRFNSPGSVDTARISGSPAVVLLKSISVWPGLQLFQVGVGSAGSNFVFGFLDMMMFTNDWMKDLMKSALSYGSVCPKKLLMSFICVKGSSIAKDTHGAK